MKRADNPRRPVVIGVGELLWDCFPGARRPGGAPANVAFHARQLDLEGVVCSRVGRDPLGDELADFLAERELGTRFIQRDDRHPTGTVTVSTLNPDQPAYTIHPDVAWDHLEFDELWADLFPHAAAVCFGTLAQRSPASRGAIMCGLAAARHALRIYDVNLRPPWYSRELIEASLRHAQVVKLNEDEVAAVAELLQRGTPDPDRFAAGLFADYGVRLVCITRGERGCLLASPGERVDLPGRPVQVADTVGAGDAFTAALTLGLLENWALAATAGFANEVGALVAGRHGAMPDLRREFEALRSAFARTG